MTAGGASRARLARSRIRGLYAITPENADTGELLTKVRLALAGGVRLVQYRSKLADRSLRFAQARQLLELCRSAAATLIVNDDIACALEVGADGAHIGRDDGEPAAARARLGPEMLLGVSCYDRLELALAAEAAGADYVAFGSVYASPTKPGAVRADLALFSRARARLQVPIVAIGGISIANAASVVAAGADALAVVSALFEAADIEAAAAAFSTFFSPKRP